VPASSLYPVFLHLRSRPVLLVGGGTVAGAKLSGLVEAGAQVTVVAPEIRGDLLRPGVRFAPRAFAPSDLDGKFFAIAAATPEVNRQVAEAAEVRGVFVNAVDDKGSASAYLGGVVRKGGVTVALSTDGRAPALAGLLREALDAVLPDDLDEWVEAAVRLRGRWRAEKVPMKERRPLLLRALQELYR
jgi:uroporphyrin-III C-methyltransferase / precorrin-2 dehydrogenase / sirohydrochlorin ferrochelatase